MKHEHIAYVVLGVSGAFIAYTLYAQQQEIKKGTLPASGALTVTDLLTHPAGLAALGAIAYIGYNNFVA